MMTKAADFMRALRSQGRAPGDTWLQHTYLGYNYRLDEMSAALGAGADEPHRGVAEETAAGGGIGTPAG